ncbi:NUDIX hydrolase [Herpetosiphon llansteffanensis]|uniref:NUDIX hydrolase n=1 Tax=Herpetosiphon llansteffanensis TaxID=2094568 RepID=UPI000D7BE3B9|nr:NUDIX hydrolase [Herpetosiphon llansteffanensis]
MSRIYPSQPLIGVSVMVWHEQRVLLVKRSKEPLAGQWSVPGGAIELGETVEAAARREIREECAVEISTPSFITAVDVIHRDQSERIQYHYVLLEMQAEWISGESQAGDDALAIGWFGVDDLTGLEIHPETRLLVETVAAQRLG